MILIGQYDSPFVRRVGIALTLYDVAFEHRPWSTFGDVEKIRPYSPFSRVPTMVLDDGFVLVDSHLMLDYLDNLVSDEQAMFPRSEPQRHRALKVAALATGLAEKVVSLFYEQRLHEAVSPLWVDRCKSQIIGALDALEADRAERATPYWFGERIGHADIAVACVLRFVTEAHPGLVGMNAYPALQRHRERLDALPVFSTISQPFIPPT